MGDQTSSNRTKKWVRGFAALLATVGLASQASAVTCQGPVTDIRFTWDRYLDVQWGFGYVRLCQFGGEYTYGTVPRTYTASDCQRIYSTAMTAMGTGSDFAVAFSGTDCAVVMPNGNSNPPAESGLLFYIRAQ